MTETRTALLALTTLSLLCAAIVASLWVRGRKLYPGIGLWAFQSAGQALAFGTLLLQYRLPGKPVLIASSVIFICTLPALGRGIDAFTRAGTGGKAAARLLLIDRGLAFCVLVSFIYLAATENFRAFTGAPIALAFVWFYGRAAFALLYGACRGHGEYRPAGIVYAIMSLGTFAGGIVQIAISPGTKADATIETGFYLALMALIVAAAFAQNFMLTGRVTANLADERARYRLTFNNAPYSIILTRASDGKILDVNERLCKYAGFREEEMLGRTTKELGLWADLHTRERLYRDIAAKGHFEAENVDFRRRDGILIPSYMSSRTMTYDGEGAILTVLKDLTEIHRLDSKIREMATLDLLTGLPNRRYFYDLAAGPMARAARGAGKIAVITVALDDFKRINETYGHTQGDQVIIESANRIKRELREGDILARFEGDEFVAFILDFSCQEDVIFVMERIMKAIQAPFEIAGVEARLSCSQGAAIFPEQADDLDRLLSLSDSMVHRVKMEGKAGYRLAKTKEE